ncbi:MAG: glycosyltransferase family 4 protein [Elusimicrobia bacterium]|nr:glycosyltransferase family 4 protein [Elusimicrobiota bacterium]
MTSTLLFSFAAGLAGAWFMARYGFTLRLADAPNPRSSHSSAVPKGGGIGILLAFLVVSWMAHAPARFMIPAAAIALIGLIGDRTHIDPKVRLAAQFTAALFSLSGAGLNPLSTVLAAIFVVGTANFFNFMDGINGIAGITGIVGFGLLGAFVHQRAPGDPLAGVAFGLAAACAGFLPFNFPRAKVFMGDVGSVLLGYVFGYAAVRSSASPADFACLCAFLFMFYADELTTMLVRLRAGEDLFVAHRRHYYQLLANERGIPHWRVSAGYGLVQLCVGACAWWAMRHGIWHLLGFLSAAFAVFCGFSFGLRRRLPTKT